MLILDYRDIIYGRRLRRRICAGIADERTYLTSLQWWKRNDGKLAGEEDN
jgi:hypothetical protein